MRPSEFVVGGLRNVRKINSSVGNMPSAPCGLLDSRPLLPNIGAEAAVKELYRTAELPGLKSFHIGQYPHGGLDISEEDDPLWAAA